MPSLMPVKQRRWLAAIDQPHVLAAHDVTQELRDDARAALLGRVHVVQPRADPVERAEQRVVELVAHAVGVDHAVEQLLGAGIDPARLFDRPVDQFGGIRIELAVVAHAVDLGGRGKQHALAVLDAQPDDPQIGLEIQLEHPQRLAHVGGRGRDRDQRQHHVAFLDVVFDPLAIDRDVALEELQPRILEQRRDAVAVHVHAIDTPVGGVEDARRQVMADEAVDAQDQYVIHGRLTPPLGRRMVLARQYVAPVDHSLVAPPKA